jgi:hypothetical protein
VFAYFTIESDDEGFRVWRRLGEQTEAVLLGTYPTLEEAKSSVPVRWRRGRRLDAWAVVEVEDLDPVG